jgi:hypothetical protein
MRRAEHVRYHRREVARGSGGNATGEYDATAYRDGEDARTEPRVDV